MKKLWSLLLLIAALAAFAGCVPLNGNRADSHDSHNYGNRYRQSSYGGGHSR